MLLAKPARSLLIAVAASSFACSGAQRCPEVPPSTGAAPATAAAAADKAAPATKATATAGPRLSIAITPDPATGTVDVEIDAMADPAALERWTIAADGGAAVLHLKGIRDAQGPIEPQIVAKPAEPLAVTLPRPVSGAVHVSYSVDSRPHPLSSKLTVDADPNRFRATGDALLLLPAALDDHKVTAQIRWDTTKYAINRGQTDEIAASPASSFGVGDDREVTVIGRELRFGVYIAGIMGRALFDTAEGHDEAAWFGYTAFDPRPIAADVAAFRTAVRELLRDKSSEPMTLLIVADNRQPGAFVASRRARSVLVHLGTAESWSGAVRIAVASEVLKAWIGSKLWVGPADAAHEAEAYWFTEGVTRHLARDLLFRFGLVTSGELLDELHGLSSVIATSAHAAEGNAALGARAKEPGVVPLLVARGALYAARTDALIRKKSGDKRRLDDVLRALFEKAREKRAPLPTSAWIDALTQELGAAEGAAFSASIERGGPIEIPEGAFGPCFRGEKRRYEAFDLGFDDDATRASDKHTIVGLRAGGPAERAGLRSGDMLIDAVIRRGRSDAPVTLTIERAGEKKTISYAPRGAAAAGKGWVRKKDIPEEACTR